MSHIRMLALDMATNTGWAYRDGESVISGDQNFAARRGESPGMQYVRFKWWLREWNGKVDLVVYEQAFMRFQDATAKAHGMESHLLAWCAENNIQHIPCNVATLKKWAVGDGRADKVLLMNEAAERYSIPIDELSSDRADALMLLAWGEAGCPQTPRKPKKPRAIVIRR